MSSRGAVAAAVGGAGSPPSGGLLPGSSLPSGISRTTALWRFIIWIGAMVLIFETILLFNIDLIGNAQSLRKAFIGSSGGSGSGSGSSSIPDKNSCEAWLEQQDQVPLLRDFNKDPLRVEFSETQGTENCAVKCHFGLNLALPKVVDAVFGMTSEPGVARVARSMESSQYYSEFELTTARSRGYTVIMTTSLASDVPVGYFSWAEYDLMSPVQAKTEKSLAAAFISNCGGHNFRLEAVTKLQAAGVTVDSYGSCLRNVHRSVDKVDALRHYKFSLAFENSNEEDYVTEKFWQSLVAGTVPVVIGAPNIQDFAPAPNSIIHIRKADDLEDVAMRMKYLASNASAYNESIGWKFQGPTDSFKALIDMAAVHSSCRLCIHLATEIHKKQQAAVNASRPCQCSRDSVTTFHLYVRERGRFQTESVFLRSGNVTVAELESAIISRFTSKKHIPVWNEARPKMLKVNGGPLRVYRVYPVGLTQRQALYSWQFTDESLVNHIRANPCPTLEVIFV